MFSFFKKQQVEPYDKSSQKPVIHASICTGEKVAGFKEIQTGKFHDIMVIRNDSDLQTFMQKYNVAKEDIVKEY
ncbi:MAG TPA: aspartate dehydrogenase [Lachnospiraceae bacterium]|nr:aspartate dehydrogenase [Lachnospiraceae bacterium]